MEPMTNQQPHPHPDLDISRFQGLHIGLETHRITDTYGIFHGDEKGGPWRWPW